MIHKTQIIYETITSRKNNLKSTKGRKTLIYFLAQFVFFQLLIIIKIWTNNFAAHIPFVELKTPGKITVGLISVSVG